VHDDPRVIPNPNCPLTIGHAEGNRLNGLTDEVEFFNRALTPEEIHAIYAAGSAGRCGPASLRVARTELAGCLQTTGKVTLAGPAPTGGLTVPLQSDNPHVTVPPSILVKAGALAKGFKILTDPVTASETATIQASIPGEELSSTLSLKPMGVKTVLLSPDPVVGGATVAGVVALQCAAGPGDITVNLSSTKPDIAAPTASTVTIPMGTNFLPFEVTTTPVTAEAKATIAATANGVKKSNALVVNPAP
jgi:hypothetical protein